MDTRPYLDYLDKELTIMGILSAVALAAPAGILSTIATKDSGVTVALWNESKVSIIAGSVFCVVASLCFYKERSKLAWHYGQICLTEALSDNESSSTKVQGWLASADSWATWWPYSWGFTFLFVGFVEYLFALFLLLAPSHRPWLSIIKAIGLFGCLVVAICTAATQYYVLTRYKFSDRPWRDFWVDLLNWKLGKKTLPHDGVYTRLKPSAVHGVGVFAIKEIPKGTYIFEPDDDTLVSFPAAETKTIPAEVRRLYEDFCVLDGDTYECPSNFNKLTPSWFLNNSKTPNVAADSYLKFYALHNIEVDEELTADYDTYSDNESGN